MDKLQNAFIMILVAAVSFTIHVSGGADPTPVPEAVAGVTEPSDTSPPANVVVPHEAEKQVRQREDSQPTEHATTEDTIELTDVGAVVAVPDSAKDSLLAPEHQLPDSVVVGEENGKFTRKPSGTAVGYYVSEDLHLLIQGINESTVLNGEPCTRPLLIVTLSANDKHYWRQRYPVSIKSVKSGENGLEPGKSVRGGVKAIGEGITPGTIEIYLELDPTTKDGKKLLVRGTFEESTIPCLRKDLEAASKRGQKRG